MSQVNKSMFLNPVGGIAVLIFQLRQERKKKMEEAMLKIMPPTPPPSRTATPAVSEIFSNSSDKSWILCSHEQYDIIE
jgi:hypothetical protein